MLKKLFCQLIGIDDSRPMTKVKLLKILKYKKVPEQMYSLDGIDNHKRFDAYAMINNGTVYKVCYIERGDITDLKTNLTEEEAYYYIYTKIKGDYRW